jgi:filamentous hemagglutinin family protein
MPIPSLARSRAALKSSASFGWSKAAASGIGVGLLLALPASPAFANPAGGAVTSGSATISSPSSHQTNVDQSSEGVVIDWSSFDIGKGQTTDFVQPNAQAIAINRIGGSNPSQILGTLDANGRLVLIDGNGMVFGKGSHVNVGSLVATSTGGSDSDLLAGKFTKAGNQNASIVNQGRIVTSQGGLVALVAPSVTNAGTVKAKLGTVALGGANKFTVAFAGDGLVSFAAAGTGPASVTNTGRLSGANVSLTARAAESVATGVVNAGGVISAQSAHQVGGNIFLDAGNGGNVSVSNARLVASGANAGSNIKVGGANENSVAIDKASVIKASVTQSGKGGKIETSGSTLSIAGKIDAGKGGSWLVDPVNLTVDSAAATTIDDSLNSRTSVTLKTHGGSSSGPGTPSSGPGDIIIASALSWNTGTKLKLYAYHSVLFDAPVSATLRGKLSLETDNGGTGGDISFDGGNVAFSKLASVLTINGASYTLVDNIATLATDIASDPGGDYALAENYNARPDGTYSTSPIATTFTGTFEGLGNSIANLTIDDTTASDLVGLFAQTSTAGVIENLGLTNIKFTSAVVLGDGGYTGGLAGTNLGLLMGDFVTGEITTTSTGSDAGGLVGLNEGTVSDSYTSVAIHGSGMDGQYGGIASGNGNCAAGALISNSYANGNVTGGDGSAVGGLVGVNLDQIANSYATGVVTGAAEDSGGGICVAGGLAGISAGEYGTIGDSYATGAVSGGSRAYVGGLVGEGSAISNSYATGAVSGTSDGVVGGLVGYGGGISDSYATGAVSADNRSYVGGLIGYNAEFEINNAYSTGAVTAGTDAFVGGLIGYNSVAVEYTYSSGQVTGGTGSEIGGLVGENNSSGGSFSHTYWDTTSSGITNLNQGAGNFSGESGITGLTTAQFQSGLPAGFTDTVWGENASINDGLPYLRAIPPT